MLVEWTLCAITSIVGTIKASITVQFGEKGVD